MKSPLSAYTRYRQSGHPWLGDVPEHWDVRPNRALFQEIRDRNHPNEPLLSVAIRQGVIRQDDLLKKARLRKV